MGEVIQGRHLGEGHDEQVHGRLVALRFLALEWQAYHVKSSGIFHSSVHKPRSNNSKQSSWEISDTCVLSDTCDFVGFNS